MVWMGNKVPRAGLTKELQEKGARAQLNRLKGHWLRDQGAAQATVYPGEALRKGNRQKRGKGREGARAELGREGVRKGPRGRR